MSRLHCTLILMFQWSRLVIVDLVNIFDKDIRISNRYLSKRREGRCYVLSVGANLTKEDIDENVPHKEHMLNAE